MYEEFFHLKDEPFRSTPDTKFLYLSERHERGLEQLLYGVSRQQGIVALLGEVGTGKTMLLHTLVEHLDEKTHTIFLRHAPLAPADMYQHIFQTLSLPHDPRHTEGELLSTFEHFLLQCAERGEKCVLMCDEAQALSLDILERLRLFSNFETSHTKLLQIILASYPETYEKWKEPPYDKIKQRIGMVYKILPMNFQETKGYIEKRLEVAGAARTLFTEEAIQEVYRCAQGVPRLINLVCDLGLFAGFSDRHTAIDRREILQAEAMLDIQIPEAPLELEIDLAPSAEAVNPVVKPESEMTHEFLQRVSMPPPRIPVTIVNPTVVEEPVQATSEGQRLSMAEHADMFLRRYGLQYAARAEAQRAASRAARIRQQDVERQSRFWSSVWVRVPMSVALAIGIGFLAWKGFTFVEQGWDSTKPPSSRLQDTSVTPSPVAPSPVAPTPVDKPLSAELGSMPSSPSLLKDNVPNPGVVSTVPAVRDVTVITVQKGETLRAVLMREYNRVDTELITWVLQANPGITNPDRLLVGQRIVLPPGPPAPR